MKVLGVKDKAKGVQKLMPVPIQASRYLQTLIPKFGEDPKMLLHKAEVGRMLQIYERYGAWLQPMKYVEGKGIFFEVQFPQGSRFASGTSMPNAWEAMEMNYIKNRKFPGVMMLHQQGSGDGPLEIAAAQAEAVKLERQRRANAVNSKTGERRAGLILNDRGEPASRD